MKDYIRTVKYICIQSLRVVEEKQRREEKQTKTEYLEYFRGEFRRINVEKKKEWYQHMRRKEQRAE